MAETSSTSVENTKNILQCAICHEQYQDPRVLPCQHGFCRECLEHWAKKSRVKGKLECPFCRKEVSLPEEGVKGLPVHFLFSSPFSSLKDICEESEKVKTCSNCNMPDNRAKLHCFDCKDDLCDDCHIMHKGLKMTSRHRVVTIEAILSGKVSDEGRYCKVHDKVIVEFYCETEQRPVCYHCISLNVCAHDHKRSSVTDAAKIKTSSVEKMIKECKGTKRKYCDVVRNTEQVCEELRKSARLAKGTLSEARRDCIQRVDDFFNKTEADIDVEELKRMKTLTLAKEDLEGHLKDIEGACQRGSKVIQSGSEYEITSSYVSLSESLHNVNQSQLIPADVSLGYLRYIPAASLAIPVLGHLSKDYKWAQTTQFGTGTLLKKPWGIAINQHGDIAITSDEDGVKVFTRTGQVKYTFKNTPTQVEVLDIAVTPDNRYIIDGNEEFLCYDSEGNQLSKTSTYDMDGNPCDPWGVAVDAMGRIIAGLNNNTVSIHQADGTLINKFATQSKPRRLAVTSKGDLVVRFADNTVKLMDSGGNVRDIQPPTDVTKWDPRYVCCNHIRGEIYVGNVGNPKAVYGFTSDGEYLGLITDDVKWPTGIAVSEDGHELFVVDCSATQVKIFQLE